MRPEFVGEEEEPQLVVRGGRHPVLDAVMDEPVVPNSTTLRGLTGPRAAIITGPNMGGKSCYIRQAALIALMAQAGPAAACWLPSGCLVVMRRKGVPSVGTLSACLMPARAAC